MRRISLAEKIIRRITASIIILSSACLAVSAYDMYSFINSGSGTAGSHDLSEAVTINPDTVGWICMDGTGIDHPVMQGRDNYEYLGRDSAGNDYAGGSIFLDIACDRSMEGSCILIHGHNISGGAMFGDLCRYSDEEFFNSNSTGVLSSLTARYELTVAGCGIVDAYDGDVYTAGVYDEVPAELLSKCSLSRKVDFKQGDSMVILSTCSGDMSDDRLIVICRAREGG